MEERGTTQVPTIPDTHSTDMPPPYSALDTTLQRTTPYGPPPPYSETDRDITGKSNIK